MKKLLTILTLLFFISCGENKQQPKQLAFGSGAYATTSALNSSITTSQQADLAYYKKAYASADSMMKAVEKRCKAYSDSLYTASKKYTDDVRTAITGDYTKQITPLKLTNSNQDSIINKHQVKIDSIRGVVFLPPLYRKKGNGVDSIYKYP